MDNKKNEINQAVLRYICACGYDKDWRSLQDTGFGRSEIDALIKLTINELRLLESEFEHLNFVQAKADRDVFWEAMGRMQTKYDANRVRDELITRNAPADLMKALYGIGTKEYASLRRSLGVSSGVGRPAVVNSEEISIKVWDSLKSICPASAHLKCLRPDQWIQLCNESGVDIRVIWSLIKQYSSPAVPPNGSLVDNSTKNTLFPNSRRSA